jgi:hypothetical protein
MMDRAEYGANEIRVGTQKVGHAGALNVDLASGENRYVRYAQNWRRSGDHNAKRLGEQAPRSNDILHSADRR